MTQHINCRCSVTTDEQQGNDLVYEDGMEIWGGHFVKVPTTVKVYVESVEDTVCHTTRFCDEIGEDWMPYAKRTWHEECPECS